MMGIFSKLAFGGKRMSSLFSKIFFLFFVVAGAGDALGQLPLPSGSTPPLPAVPAEQNIATDAQETVGGELLLQGNLLNSLRPRHFVASSTAGMGSPRPNNGQVSHTLGMGSPRPNNGQVSYITDEADLDDDDQGSAISLQPIKEAVKFAKDCLTNAHRSASQQKSVEASLYLGQALTQWDRIKSIATGSNLKFDEDADDDTSLRWIPWTLSGKPDAQVLTSETPPCLAFSNENSAFSFIRLINKPATEKTKLHWAWRLDRMLPGVRGKDAHSINQPLSVVVVFPRLAKNEIAAIHYVWEPLDEEKNTKWAASDDELIHYGSRLIRIKHRYVVTASARDMLPEPLVGNDTSPPLINVTTDVGVDFKFFFQESPPPIRAVIISTNCQEGTSEKPRVAKGSIGGLRFSPSSN